MVPLNSHSSRRMQYFIHVLKNAPSAVSEIRGSAKYPEINGRVYFYQTSFGVLVLSQVFGLPESDMPCKKRVFAFHIHSGGSCTGNGNDAFSDTLGHYNPENCEHPYHAGDLLPLFGCGGYAFEVFLSDRFYVNDIIGKTVIVHSNPDDFTSQPSGNAGEKIACGEIERYRPGRFPV